MRSKPVVKVAFRDDTGVLLCIWPDDVGYSDVVIGSDYELVGIIRTVQGRRLMLQPACNAVRQYARPTSTPISIPIKETPASLPIATSKAAKPKRSVGKKILKGIAAVFVLATIAGASGSDTPSVVDNQKVIDTTSATSVEPAAEQAPVAEPVAAPPAPVPVPVPAPVPPPAPVPTPVPTPSYSSGSCSGYVNVDGNCIPSPSSASGVQDGYSPTFTCRDGTYSYAQNSRGACSHHGGITR